MQTSFSASLCRFGRRLLVQILNQNENASVKIPDDESICRYKIAIGNKQQ